MAFKTATVQTGKVVSTQSNFPVYVDLDRLGITTLAEAESVRVYADSAKTTEWAREIVSVTEMHVKVPSLTSSTEIFVDWDGVRSDYAVGATYGRNAVWTGYTAVYHNGGGNDSTGSGDTGSALGSASLGGAAGKFGSGTSLNGSTQAVAFGNNYSLSPLYVSLWVKLDTVSERNMFVSKWDGQITAREFIFEANGTTMRAFVSTSGSFQGANGVTGGTTLSSGVFYKVAFVFNGSGTDLILYLNGVQDGINTSGPATKHSGAARHIVGAEDSRSGIGNQLDGIVQEHRVTNSVISANYELTEYNNQNDEATFWGTWTDTGGGGGGAAQTARRGAVMMM